MRVYSRHLTKLRHIEETKGPEKSGSFVLGKEKTSKVLLSAKKITNFIFVKVPEKMSELLLPKKSYFWAKKVTCIKIGVLIQFIYNP